MTPLDLFGQYGPLALAVSLVTLMATAVFKGWLIPRGVVEHLHSQWEAVDNIREAARKEEREQMAELLQATQAAMRELAEALR